MWALVTHAAGDIMPIHIQAEMIEDVPSFHVAQNTYTEPYVAYQDTKSTLYAPQPHSCKGARLH